MGELDKYLKEVGERESRATIGPWRGFAGVIRTEHGSHGCNDPDVHKHGTDDSLFIAHSRQDIPKLLEIVKVLREALSACEKEIDIFYENMEQESRKQTIWEEDHNLWYARDVAQQALTKAGEIAKKGLVE